MFGIDLDPVLLARIQFAFTISFHIVFPAFTIGLASWLAVVEGLWLKTGNDTYKQIYKFWIKIMFRDGRGFGRCHVVSIRHELVGIFRPGRQCHRAAFGL